MSLTGPAGKSGTASLTAAAAERGSRPPAAASGGRTGKRRFWRSGCLAGLPPFPPFSTAEPGYGRSGTRLAGCGSSPQPAALPEGREGGAPSGAAPGGRRRSRARSQPPPLPAAERSDPVSPSGKPGSAARAALSCPASPLPPRATGSAEERSYPTGFPPAEGAAGEGPAGGGGCSGGLVGGAGGRGEGPWRGPGPG